MPKTVTVTDARATLSHIVERVIAGEEVTLTRHGTPVAVVVRPDSLRIRRADNALALAARVRDGLDNCRNTELLVEPTLSEERADELLAEIRASRNNR